MVLKKRGDNVEVKDRVKALRKENHLTQEDMANLLGISPGGYSALDRAEILSTLINLP